MLPAPKDYINTTVSYPFKSSLVAANVPGMGISELSEATRLELFKLNMRQSYTTTVGFVRSFGPYMMLGQRDSPLL